MSAHTRTWNLKAALGPKPCKVNQQYRHTNVNQHVLAEEVPENTNESNSFTKKSIVQSCQICSVAPIQTSIKKRLAAWRRTSLISAFLWNYIQPRSSTICCRKRHPNQDQSIYSKLYINDSQSFCINRIQASNTWQLLLLRSKATISIQFAI